MPRERLGVVLPNWLGDAVMATPTVRALRDHFGASAHLIGIMKPKVAELLEGVPWFNERLIYDRSRGSAGPGVRWLVGELRRRQLDRIILLPNSLSSGLIGWLSGAPERIGYDRDLRGQLLTTRVQPRRGNDGRYVPISAVDYYLRLAEALGCRDFSRRVELATTPADELAADTLWEHYQIRRRRLAVAFNTGGAFGSSKHWPAEYYVELAKKVVREWDATVLIVGGPAEQDTAHEIARQAADARVIAVAGAKLPLRLMKACLRRCDLLVSTDSGPRHMAAAFQVPTVALFGPIHPLWSVNYNLRETQLFLKLPCSPCNQATCPLTHHRCMRDLTVEAVLAAIRRQLPGTDPSAPRPAEVLAQRGPTV